jgi:hypothetical protein
LLCLRWKNWKPCLSWSKNVECAYVRPENYFDLPLWCSSIRTCKYASWCWLTTGEKHTATMLSSLINNCHNSLSSGTWSPTKKGRWTARHRIWLAV